jgi:hypothetical protein
MSEEIKIPEKTIIVVFIICKIIAILLGLFVIRVLVGNVKYFLHFSILVILSNIITAYITIYLFKKEVDYLENKHYNIVLDVFIILCCYFILNIILNTISRTTGFKKKTTNVLFNRR